MNLHKRFAAAAALAAALVCAAGLPAGADPAPAPAGPAATTAGPAATAVLLPCVRSLSVGDRSVVEGTPTGVSDTTYTLATFAVTSTGCSRAAATVSWGTMGMSASAPWDYVAWTGTVTFPAGSHATRWVTVLVKKDSSPGPNESYLVLLHTPSSGTVLGDATGVGAIVNDDTVCVPPPGWNPQPPYYGDYHCSE